MRFMGKLLAALTGGLISGVLGDFISNMILLDVRTDSTDKMLMVGGSIFGMLLLLSFVLAFNSRTAGRAWRKVMLLCGALSAFIPIAALIFSVGTAPDLSDQESVAGMAGTAIGGGLVTTFAAIVGLALATVFSLIALMCGRDERVVIVERPQRQNDDYRDSPLMK